MARDIIDVCVPDRRLVAMYIYQIGSLLDDFGPMGNQLSSNSRRDVYLGVPYYS